MKKNENQIQDQKAILTYDEMTLIIGGTGSGGEMIDPPMELGEKE